MLSDALDVHKLLRGGLQNSLKAAEAVEQSVGCRVGVALRNAEVEQHFQKLMILKGRCSLLQIVLLHAFSVILMYVFRHTAQTFPRARFAAAAYSDFP